jgi:hypothetical protein
MWRLCENMGLRQDIEKKIERKREEMRNHELAIREGASYVQALQETLKMLPRESAPSGNQQNLRPGSEIAKAREAIKKAGKPLHIGDLLKAIGRTNDKKSRLSLSGSIAHYVRNGQIFTRPAPNTYGLVELENHDMSEDIPEDESDTHVGENGALPLQ